MPTCNTSQDCHADGCSWANQPCVSTEQPHINPKVNKRAPTHPAAKLMTNYRSSHALNSIAQERVLQKKQQSRACAHHFIVLESGFQPNMSFKSL